MTEETKGSLDFLWALSGGFPVSEDNDGIRGLGYAGRKMKKKPFFFFL